MPSNKQTELKSDNTVSEGYNHSPSLDACILLSLTLSDRCVGWNCTVTAFPFGLGYFLLGLTTGYVYGIGFGMLIVVVANSIGVCMIFYICHTGWKAKLERTLAGKPKLEAFMRAVKEYGWKLVVLGRVTPIPIGIVNVVCSISGVPFMTYAVASVIGLVPEQVLMVYLGTRMESIADIASGDRPLETPELVSIIVEAVLLVVLFIVLAIIGQRVLRKIELQQQQQAAAGGGDAETSSALPQDLELGAVPGTIASNNYSDRAGLLANAEDGEGDVDDDDDDDKLEVISNHHHLEEPTDQVVLIGNRLVWK
ncbi:hypothetical protein, variant [Capsaspora owczarzaki ATCC 30864]|uniref:VTT domain-containing protein n=1 Tax=Capsaspora owczarzaki (strain ATCC 30864) TaxID=595528 RepID=A0A0D2X177_CAPO3|nr:hypothetical protein, variant [Capsaspora owczarzaki ATCC 30864]